ncbi:MAG: 1,4-dihydroxy-6-naphthoate synthase [Bacteroidetes bacterium]|nr:1,4-dihydroxy-6-naphthoate synthase [Bacteroidota bacterium]
MKLTLAYSTCPNDTFIFGALVNGLIDSPFTFEVILEDIKELNARAAQGGADVCKLSFYALTQLSGWTLLPAGAALGRGCGPLLVAREPLTHEQLIQSRIALPGWDTTAHLLLQYYAPEARNKAVMLFSDIMPAVAEGRADVGLIIHESRFTYPTHGLVCLQDLGDYWERRTGLPIPLGGIAAQTSLGAEAHAQLTDAIRRSLAFAWAHPDAVMPYVAQHAQELSEEVMWQHIRLYVNDFSLELGTEGQAAITQLQAVAAAT